MTSPSHRDPSRIVAGPLGSLLVLLQFGLIVLLALGAAPALHAAPAQPLPWFLLALGAGAGLWALACNRPGNFNIRPTPREGGRMVSSGPNRWVRHPMYSAVLTMAAGAAWATAAPWGGAAWVALGAVLLAKAHVEERAMLARHPDYAAYQRRTHRLLPGLF